MNTQNNNTDPRVKYCDNCSWISKFRGRNGKSYGDMCMFCYYGTRRLDKMKKEFEEMQDSDQDPDEPREPREPHETFLDD